MPLTIRVHERLNKAFNPKTVKIGEDVWMAENLAINDGGDGIYFSKETNMYYYDWNAAKRIADSIPGWHLPSIGEWAVACDNYRIKPIYYIGDEDNARKLYARLKVKLAGYCFEDLYNVGSVASFWTEDDCSGNADRISFDTNATIEHSIISKKCKNTIRLIKD